jgi:RNA polymerase sigma-70 factor, ECF subfamily
MYDDADDPVLVAAIRAGDQKAWTALLTRYQNRLYTVCFRMVRDREAAFDLTQESLVKVIQGMPRFDGRAKLSTWMIRITMNVCLSHLRSEKLRRHASLSAPMGRQGEPMEFADEWEPNAAGRVESEDDRRRVLAGLDMLEPDQRAILVLRDCRGLDYDQIAGVLDLPVGTVKSRLFRARAALREAVESLAHPKTGAQEVDEGPGLGELA